MASILATGLGGVQAIHEASYEAGGGNASGDYSVAIGASASSVGNHSVSIGAGASSAEEYGVAIGKDAKSVKEGAISMGYKAEATGTNAMALGKEAQAHGEDGSISIGVEAITGNGGSGSVAIGTSAKTEAADSVALGSYTLGNRNKGVLGYDPSKEFVVKGANGTLQISTDKQGTTSNTAASTWQSTRGAVSIGNSETGDTRQLIGLAAGSEDTDGVNVAQLKSLETATYKTIDAAAKGLRGEIHQGNAMTAALAALKPIRYKVDEPTQVMVGIGKQEEKMGYALGVAHYTNERTMFNAGAAFSDGQMIYNLGATLRFGKGGKAVGAFGDNASLSVLSDAIQAERQQNDRQEQAIINLQSDNRQLRADIEMLKQLVSAKK
ncbi:YadA-like family protein [Veillonella sp. CHU740]|uniref:YadA-like family protein n=1 Tax=Veillonella sp. CHU740 TaxID=2490950 RepID=UPI0013E0B2E4|nr:YadA-like family protein [Veillonella sp. CHU740]